LACAGKGFFDERTVGRDDFDLNAANGEDVAGFCGDVLIFA